MAARVASIDIVASLIDNNATKNYKKLQNKLDDMAEKTHKRELGRVKQRREAYRNLITMMDRFRKGGTSGMARDFSMGARAFGHTLNAAARDAGHTFARSSGKFMMKEMKGIAANIPGTKGIKKLLNFKGPLLGTLLSRLIVTPLEALKAPFKVTSLMKNYLPGLALLAGVPVLIRTAVNAAGAALAALGPIALSAFAVMQQGVVDLARTTGQSVEALRNASVFGAFGGGKSREEAMKFFGEFDSAAGGNLKTLKGGGPTAASAETMKKMSRLKDFKFGQGGQTVFDAILGTKSIDKRMALFGLALEKLRSGKAIDKFGKKIGKDAGEKMSRELANAVGPKFAKDLLKSADEARRRGIGLDELFKERSEQKGFLSEQTITNVDRITDSIGKMIRSMTGAGTLFANAKLDTVRQWFEDFATFLDETKEQRANMFGKIFDVNANGITKFFHDLANPTPNRITTDPVTGELSEFFENPRTKFMREMEEFLVRWVGQAKEFMATLNGIWTTIKQISTGDGLGSGFMKWAKLVGGATFGLVNSTDQAVKMGADDLTDRYRHIFAGILTGAGVEDATPENALEKWGFLTGEFISKQFKRLNNHVKELGGFSGMFGEFGKGFATEGMQEGGMHDQLRLFIANMAEGLKGTGSIIWKALFEGEAGTLVFGYGVDLGKKIAQGIMEGLGWNGDLLSTLAGNNSGDGTFSGSNKKGLLGWLFGGKDHANPTASDILDKHGRLEKQRSSGERTRNIQGDTMGGETVGMKDVMVRSGQANAEAGKTQKEAAAMQQQNVAAFGAAVNRLGSFAIMPGGGGGPTMRNKPPTGRQTPVSGSGVM